MAKFKLDLDELSPQILSGFGINSPYGVLQVLYNLNLQSTELHFSRLAEDIFEDYRNTRFYYRLFGYQDFRQELDIRLVENRSYSSTNLTPQGFGLFDEAPESEKNWLPNKDGFNFFLWFEGNLENVKFTLSILEQVQKCSHVHQAKALDTKYLDKINKQVKYLEWPTTKQKS